MARYRIIHWREIPSMVEAIDGEHTARHPLSPRFQELIDVVAMRAGAAEADAYLEGWGQGADAERPGSAEEVARAVADEIEAGFAELAAQRLRPPA